MSRRTVGLTLDNLPDLPEPCRDCVVWELSPHDAVRARRDATAGTEKEAWLSDTLLHWGSCGLILYVASVPAGHALFAPAEYVPRAGTFATSPIGLDAILLVSLRLRPQYRGAGLGRVLAQGVVREIARRGARAIEAFGIEGGDGEGGGDEVNCLLPAGYLRAVGFKTIRAHPRVSRLRLDIRSAATWRADVESALDKLLSTLPVPRAPRLPLPGLAPRSPSSPPPAS